MTPFVSSPSLPCRGQLFEVPKRRLALPRWVGKPRAPGWWSPRCPKNSARPRSDDDRDGDPMGSTGGSTGSQMASLKWQAELLHFSPMWWRTEGTVGCVKLLNTKTGPVWSCFALESQFGMSEDSWAGATATILAAIWSHGSEYRSLLLQTQPKEICTTMLDGSNEKNDQEGSYNLEHLGTKYRKVVLWLLVSSKVQGCHRWASIVPVDGSKDQRLSNEAPWFTSPRHRFRKI